MTQENKSARNKSLSRLHRSIPAQGLCWLGSFSLLSSGFVYAQTESAIDNIVPTTQSTNSVGNSSTQSLRVERIRKTSPESTSSQVEFSSRRARLRERLNHNPSTQAEKPVVRLREKLAGGSSSGRKPQNTTQSRPKLSPQQSVAKQPNPQPAVVNQLKTPVRVNTQSRQSQSVPSIPADTTKAPVKDYNSAYLDPTDYKLKPTANNAAPTTVVVRSRSGECRVIGNDSTQCAQVPIASNRNQNQASTAKASVNAPNWMRKSENIRTTTATSNPQRIASTNSSGATRTTTRSPQNRPTSNQIASASPTTKNSYNSNRFIPAPSSFIPPSAPTTVSSVPIAPKGGVLPLPINADLTAPRPSNVAYNIPLQSTLPQIAYTGNWGGFASNPSGISFPLSIPAPITSLFGWRTHPITGDRRFHSGTDIGAPMGTPVLAAATGKVEIADYVGGYGLTAIINHNNAQQTLYGHMSQVYVQPGQWVQQGAVIGLVGNTGNSTGPHLHFEVRQLTPNGWVAVDAGVQLQFALQQMSQMLRTAQIQSQTTNSDETR